MHESSLAAPGGRGWRAAARVNGVDHADRPTELITDQLWHGGCPVDFGWVRNTGIAVVLDLAEAYPSADQIDGLMYLKAPLADGDELPHPELTLGIARPVADLVGAGHAALVHCTFGRKAPAARAQPR